jgi:hypothetical protein
LKYFLSIYLGSNSRPTQTKLASPYLKNKLQEQVQGLYNYNRSKTNGTDCCEQREKLRTQRLKQKKDYGAQGKGYDLYFKHNEKPQMAFSR